MVMVLGLLLLQDHQLCISFYIACSTFNIYIYSNSRILRSFDHQKYKFLSTIYSALIS